MMYVAKVLVLALLSIPAIALAVDVPELPMKVYGSVSGSGVVSAYVGDTELVSVTVSSGTIGYAPDLFLIPGTVPEGTTVVLQANGEELDRFAFEHGASREVALTIVPPPATITGSVAMLFTDVSGSVGEVVAKVGATASESITQIVDTGSVIAQSVVSGFLGALGLSTSPLDEGTSLEAPITEREGFVTYTGQEQPRNQLLAAAGGALPEGAWWWIGGLVGLVGVGGLAFVRFKA